MARTSAGEKGTYVALPEDLLEGIKRLAESNGRPLKDEVAHALRRHLDAPPQLITPAMPAVEMETPTPKKRGRRSKKEGG